DPRHLRKLEHQLQRQLKNARFSSTRDLTELPIGLRAVRRSEVNVVEDVEGLSAELDPGALGYLGVLDQRHIGAELPRAAKDVLACVPICTDGVWRKYRCIEPLLNLLRVRPARAQLRAAGSDEIGAVLAHAAQGIVIAAENRERESPLP